MKRTAYLNPRSATRLVLAAACILILAAACTTDDDPLRPDNAADGDAPVPFTFTAVAPPAMTDANTRAVPGNDTWEGDGTEKIWVYIQVDRNPSKSSTGIYTVISPEGKTAVLPGDPPALWPNASEQRIVYAWYPALEPGKEYNISDQSTPEKLRQADVLRAEMWGLYDVNFIPDLTFEHQMIKVRVELTGVNASATDIEVGILSHIKFVVNQWGNTSASGTQDYITACRDTEDAGTVAFEAIFVRNDIFPITKQNFIRIKTGGRTYYFTPGADSPDYPHRGRAYTYTVDLSSPTTRTAPAGHPAVFTSTVKPFNTSER